MKNRTMQWKNREHLSRIGLCVGLVLLFCMLGIAPALASVLELPSSLTQIADEAFMNDTSITSVVIPDGATSIGARAFAGCGNLETITVPDSVTAIGEDAFDSCEELRISAPEGSYAYEWAMSKGYIEMPETPIEYFTYAIDDGECTITGYTGSATDIVIPDKIENSPVICIGSSAFSNCSHLISISIPDGVRRIREFAFENCSSLKSINIPDGVTSIANWVFSGCSSLVSVNIPAGVKTIWHDAFSGCSSLISIDIPDGVTCIQDSTFRDCSSLKNIDIPSGVISIENGAFWGCSSLESVDIPAGVTSIESSTFRDCSKLTSINIPAGVISIKQGAFENCNSLISIDIPDGVTTIEGEAFWGCSSLESIDIPTGVTSIAEWLFAGCSSLKNIGIPAGVTSIGNYAFIDCSSLVSIDIPVGVTSIGQSAFTNCSSLMSIDIPDGVVRLEYMVFSGCSNLERIDMPDEMTSLEEYAFYDCKSLISVDIPNGVTSIANSAFKNCSSLISIGIPDGMTSIGEDAFWNCSSLVNIDIPAGVTSIGESAFTYCNSLKNIVIPAGVTSIEDWTFNSCASLASVNIPYGVTRIGNRAFSWCESLTSILIPVSVESIANTAFSSCFNLTIYGVSGSYAETYAAENGIEFSTLSMPEYDYGDYDMTATVSVVSPEGIPMENAEISVYDYDYDTLFGSGITDENGQCVISGLQKNRMYRFICSCETFEYEEICRSASSQSLSITFKPEEMEGQYLITVPRAHTMAMEASAVNFNITTSGAWTVSCDADWLRLSTVSGEGDAILEVSAAENTGKFRVAVLNFATADSEWQAYIYQTGALSSRLDAPTITYPAANGDSVSFGDITVTWDAVEFADSYVVSLRDLDTDTLLLHHQAISDQTQANLSSLYFDDAHSYRVAVGAVPFGKESTDTTVGWCERVFAVDEYVSDEEVEFVGTVYELYDAVLANNVQTVAATYSMDADMMANVRATAESGIDFMAAANTAVEVYHLNAEENTWEYVTAAQTDEGGQYSIKGGLIAGDDYSFVFIRDNCSFIMGAVERLTYTAQPGKNSIIDVYCFNIDLEEQIEAFRKIQGYDVTGRLQGLYAEYFAFSDKNKAFTASNKRNEGRITHVNFSWTGDEESEGYLNWKKSYYVLNTFKFEAEHVKENRLFRVNYVPFKFAARYNGYIMLKGATNADALAAYKFRLRGDDGIRFTMGLPSYETYTSADWSSRGLIENKAEIDLSSVGYLNGTVMKLNIEYYNKSTGGEANLIFEYSVDDGDTWNVVPESWLYMGDRTVSIMNSEEEAGIDYVKLMAKSTDKLKNYGDELTSKMLSDITGMSVNNTISAYNKGTVVFGNVTISNGEAMVRFWQQKLGKKAAKAVYTAIYNEACGVSDEETIWAEIKEQIKKEFNLEFDTIYDSTKSVIDGIGTLQSLSAVLSDNALSNASIESLQKAILENIERYTIGDLKDLDKDGSTSGAGYSTLFELSGTERETVKDEAIKLDSNVNIVWKFTTKAIQLLERLWGIEDSNTNRAMFSLMYEEQGGTPDLFDASLYIADFDLGDAFYKLHNSDGSPKTYSTRSEFEVALNSLSNSSINNMAAQTVGVDLETLLYKDLLKLTLDTAYSYYKGLLK